MPYTPDIDIRDYTSVLDGSVDVTACIARAQSDAGLVGNPSTVYMPAGQYLTGPVSVPIGVSMLGEGMMGRTTQESSRCTVLVARESATDIGPAFTCDSGVQPYPAQWTRNTEACNIGVDVSRSSRFTQAISPPPVFGFYGVSNVAPFRCLIAFGNIGPAFEIAPGKLPTSVAISENLTFVDCGCYGGNIYTGGITSKQPAGPMIVARGVDQLTWDRGLVDYDSSSPITVPFPLMLITPVVDAQGIVRLGQNGTNILGLRGTNLLVGIQISVVEAVDGGALQVCGPCNINIERLMLEGVRQAFAVGQEAVTAAAGYWRIKNLRIKGSSTGCYAGRFDNMISSDIDFPFMAAGSVVLGPNTYGNKITVGVNPNGPGYHYEPVDLGQNNSVTVVG